MLAEQRILEVNGSVGDDQETSQSCTKAFSKWYISAHARNQWGSTGFGQDKVVRALGCEGHEAATAVQQPLSQAHKEQRFRVLREELSLLAQGLGAAAVVGACSNQANAEDGLERGDFVPVVSETRQRLEHFRLGVGNVEHGHSHGYDAAEGGVTKLKKKTEQVNKCECLQANGTFVRHQ